MNSSPHHFVNRVCVRMLDVMLDGALDGMLHNMLNGTLYVTPHGMLVGA